MVKYNQLICYTILLITIVGLCFPSHNWAYNQNVMQTELKYTSIAESEYLVANKWGRFLDLLAAAKRAELATLQTILGQEVVIDTNQITRSLFQAFSIGSIFIIGVNHLVIFFGRSKEISALYIALASFAFVVRASFIKETLFANLIYPFSAETILTVDMVSGFFAMYFYLHYMKREFIPGCYWRYVTLWGHCMLLFICCILFLPLEIVLKHNYLYPVIAFVTLTSIIAFSVLASVRKLSGSKLNLIGITFLFLLVWNDFTGFSMPISANEFISVGMLIYLFLMTIHLSRKSSTSFKEVESLSAKLRDLNVMLENKVAQRTNELLKKTAVLKKEEQSRRKLLMSVSHELNTPLTYIHGYIRAILDGVVPKGDASYLRAVYQDTEMMKRIIHDLQDLSQLESGLLRLSWEDICIQTFLDDAMLEQQSLFYGKTITMSFLSKLPIIDKPVICRMDGTRVEQVVKNLLVNAYKFTPDGGNIRIEAEISMEQNPNVVQISVHDTGVGIETDDLPYVFERFYKGDRYNGIKGSGLGLAISKEIIDQHGGKMSVESEVENGSTFYFTLPIKRGSTSV